MKKAKSVFYQIYQLTRDLVETAICVDQNFPYIKDGPSGSCDVEVPQVSVAKALKKQPYHELYHAMNNARSFNIKFVDGAMMLLQYHFENDNVTAHRLCFFPNPDLLSFQNNSEEYLEDEVYLDILDPRIVSSPIRFDFDIEAAVGKSIIHPASHLTIGQYENCRIPVISPIMPSQFFDFVIRNFYNTAYEHYSDLITKYTDVFDSTITPDETKLLHISTK